MAQYAILKSLEHKLGGAIVSLGGSPYNPHQLQAPNNSSY